jgi:hypothetical protein
MTAHVAIEEARMNCPLGHELAIAMNCPCGHELPAALGCGQFNSWSVARNHDAQASIHAIKDCNSSIK